MIFTTFDRSRGKSPSMIPDSPSSLSSPSLGHRNITRQAEDFPGAQSRASNEYGSFQNSNLAYSFIVIFEFRIYSNMVSSSFNISYVEQNSINLWPRYLEKCMHDEMEGENLVTFHHFCNFEAILSYVAILF